MKIQRTLCFVSYAGLGACSPGFDIVDQAGMPMFEIHRGFCFVGCNLKVKRSDGEDCSGWAIGLEEGKNLNAQVLCPDDPHPRDLKTEALSREAASVGVLGAPMTLEQRNTKAIEAALAQAAELSQEN